MRRSVKKKYSRKKLQNTNNRSCKIRKYTGCCPHMSVNSNGQYAATATKHILKYNGKKYSLMTCCQMCGDNMNSLAKKNPKMFSKIYIDHIDKKGNIHVKHKDTRKIVQILKLIK